jgi:hypothetical protein
MSAAAAPLAPLKQPPGQRIGKIVGVGLFLYGVASLAGSFLGLVFTWTIESNYVTLEGPLFPAMSFNLDLVGLVMYGIASCFVLVVGRRVLSGKALGLAPLMVGVFLTADASTMTLNPNNFMFPWTLNLATAGAGVVAIILAAFSLILFARGQRKAKAFSMLLAMLAVGLFYYWSTFYMEFPPMLGSFSQFYFSAYGYSTMAIENWAGGSFIDTYSSAVVGSSLVFFAAEGALALGALVSLVRDEGMEGVASTWRDLAAGAVSFFFGFGVFLIGANLLYNFAVPLGYVWLVVPSQVQGSFQLQVLSLVVCFAVLALLVAGGMAFVIGSAKAFSAGDHSQANQGLAP